MRFEVRMQTDFRCLLALNVLAERTFRRKTMVIFRLVMLALTALLGWNVWENYLEDGIGFTLVCKCIATLFLLACALIPNILSAVFGQAAIQPGGSIVFDNGGFSERGVKTVEHRYSDVDRLIRFRGYDFVFLDPQSSFILSPKNLVSGDVDAFHAFLEEKTGKTFKII